MGWSGQDAARHLGFKKLETLKRILDGGRPAVKFLLRLAHLEEVYEREIQQFIYRRRPFMYYRRSYLEGTLHPHLTMGRKSTDLAEVGKVGTSRPLSVRPQRRRDKAKARRYIIDHAARRRKTKTNKAARVRQSYAEFKRQKYLTYRIKRLAARLEREEREVQKEDKGNGTGCESRG